MLGSTPAMLGSTPTMLGTTPTMLGSTPTMLGSTPTMLGTSVHQCAHRDARYVIADRRGTSGKHRGVASAASGGDKVLAASWTHTQGGT